MHERVHILGIRHHGPGSAASVDHALEEIAPAQVLIEGPPEADAILPLAAKAGMRPPVAILTYPAEAPEQARFYPFAEYSPEWRAMLWAVRHGRVARFIDLPAEPRRDADEGEDSAEVPAPPGETQLERVRRDPLTHLARAAGHSDGESWWNALVEQAVHAPAVFDAIAAAMAALREADETADESCDADTQREARREAHMRLAIRAALKDTDGAVAVVCGAWHAPALASNPSISSDRALLKGLRKAKVESCWVPWTDTRLAASSGYGAGVISPGWYRHLWQMFAATPQSHIESIARWQAQAANLLR